ncbi:MAG: SDR family oxidoreductase [Terracidiphilus sp.]|jgi:NADP-dependent 3-hydroxy acid dehydrogenase YdfG
MSEYADSKVAVITGAAGGIGAAVTRALSGAGYRLVLNGRSAEKLKALASQLKSPFVIVAGDLQDATIPQSLLSAALDAFGRCDLCFNNGGILEVGSIESIDIERVCEMVRVNVEGAFRVAYVFLKHFVQQKSGHLINTSSVLGTKVRPTAGAYAATKHAIEALSEALRIELSKTDVQVSCIQPGLVRTGLHDRWVVPPAEAMGIAEPLTPADIARMVLFILEQPAHVRIPQLMILPKGHEI